MATGGEDEVEYESDPEEAKRSLTMRRREASDDEEGDDEREGPPRVPSEIESDGQGAPEEYDDDEEEEEDELVIGEGEYSDLVEEEEIEEVRDGEGGGEVAEAVENQAEGEVERDAGELGDGEGEGEGKKENEPFAVPTAGAFYMHDDRFRNNVGGRNRRTLGGRKLWESRDDGKWDHDKFEEMKKERRYDNERTGNPRGRHRGRGKRGADRGNSRVNNSRAHDNYNQNQVPKTVKGRGHRMYDSVKKNSVAPPTQYRKRSDKSVENLPRATSGRALTASANSERGPVPSSKQAFASSLSSASPPFYPSGSSNKETTSMQKTDGHAGNVNRKGRSADVDEKFNMSQSNTVTTGRNMVDSVHMDKLYINDSISTNAGKPSSSLQLPSSVSPMVSAAQHLHPRAHGRGVASSVQMAYQPITHNQVVRASPLSEFHNMQQNSVQSGGQSSIHQMRQFSVSGSQSSSSAKAALSANPVEHGESDRLSESAQTKSALVGKGKDSVQGGGKGSFIYGGSQVMGVSGNMNNSHGDQNFAATPTFLPVMPFGNQHPGGMGVPAVGMAFPGYVAQPNGSGSSEMTWLPVLASTAGALGSAYGSPYIALDGAYHARSSLQTSSSGASSKESITNKSINEWKPSQRPDVTSDEVGQRQRNTRRYTEMKFGPVNY